MFPLRQEFELVDGGFSHQRQGKLRCMYETKTRCKRPASCTLDLCVQHLQKQHRIDVRSAPGRTHAGLFALDDIEEGQFICSYIGDVIDKETLRRRYGDGKRITPYAVCMSDGVTFIDSASWGGLGTLNFTGETNAELFEAAPFQFPMVVATQDITKGEEIIVDYGELYFC